MEKIDVAEFAKLKLKFLKYITKHPTVNAVISNTQFGNIYSDINRNNLFVVAKHGWSMLIAKDVNEIGSLFEFLKTNREIPDYIHLLPPNEDLIDYIKLYWPKYKIRERCQLRYLGSTPSFNQIMTLPQDFSLVKIQSVEFSKLQLFELEFDKRYWNSKDDFYKNAIGVCVVNKHNEPVAICYSICIVDRIAELEIYVLPEFKGKGIGQIMAQSFIKLSIDNGFIAHWDTFSDNVASFQLAKKLGFVEIYKYNMVSTFLRDW